MSLDDPSLPMGSFPQRKIAHWTWGRQDIGAVFLGSQSSIRGQGGTVAGGQPAEPAVPVCSSSFFSFSSFLLVLLRSDTAARQLLTSFLALAGQQVVKHEAHALEMIVHSASRRLRVTLAKGGDDRQVVLVGLATYG